MYKEFFGLNRSPFDLSPDPFFMFSSEKSLDALASISYAVSQRKGFAVMTGEVGTGKTLILRCLFELWEREQIPFAYFIGPRLSTIDFLSYITLELGIKVVEPTKGRLLRALYGFFLAQFENGLTTILVIDEAHQVPRSVLEEIRLLTNFETAQQKLVQILLVGQPELDKKLDSFELRSLKQRIAVRCHLEPLAAEETSRYIQRRLELAGAQPQGEAIFPPETTEAIFRYSQGIPRLINSICDQSLMAACARQLHVVPAEIVDQIAHHFRLLPAAQTERTAPEKSWLSSSHSQISAMGVSDSHDVATQTRSEPAKIPEVATEFSPPSRKEESQAAQLLSSPPIVVNTAALPTEASEAPLPASSQDSLLGTERASAAPAPPSTVYEPGPKLQSASIFQRIGESNKPRHGSGPLQLRSSLESLLQLARPSPGHVRARPTQQPAALKRALSIGAGTIVVLGFATGGILAYRHRRAVRGDHPTWTFFSGSETDASTAASPQPAARRAAEGQAPTLTAAPDSAAAPANRVASKPTGVPEHLESPKKFAISALPKPVVQSASLPNSAEPPPSMGTTPHDLTLGKGLLDISSPAPTPPGATVGGHLQAPRLISSSPPVYPSRAVMEQVQGVVVVDILVDQTGKVTDMKVISGPGRLIQAALNAIATWKYEPARLNGQIIATHTQVSVDFHLH